MAQQSKRQACGLWRLERRQLKVLEIAKQIKSHHDMPIVIMTYYNPVFRIGLEKVLPFRKRLLG